MNIGAIYLAQALCLSWCQKNKLIFSTFMELCVITKHPAIYEGI